MNKEDLDALQKFMIDHDLELTIKPTVTGRWFAELYQFTTDTEFLYLVEDNLPDIMKALFIKITN